MMNNKFEIEAKQAKEKRENERRKNILILILRYIVNMGYAETACQLQTEANLDLDRYDVADNIDLYMILADYEEYFELRFNKKPKFVTKLIEREAGVLGKLPSIKGKESKNISNSNLDKKTPNSKNKISSAAGTKKPEIPGTNKISTETNEMKLELVGQGVNVNKKKEENNSNNKEFTFNDQKESILLKPIPDNFFGNNELKELAGLVRR
jgi:katanin p60 ATPase-containing subunit A1